MTSGNAIKRLIRRSIWLTCLAYMVDDWRARRRLVRGRLTTASGARHMAPDLEASLAYIERVHRDYLSYAGRETLVGTVAEIGPGDNFGVALLLLGGGAAAVHAIDRYRPVRDQAWQSVIYRALAVRHGLAMHFDGPPTEATLRGVVRHAGVAAEDFFKNRPATFDAILSRAVMEHLYDPLAALDDMATALRPGGILVHRIDLRDHGMFAGRHPLTFLTIPDRLYGAMTRGAGRPNRVLLADWRAWLARSGLAGSLRVTRLAGVAEELSPCAWDDVDSVLRDRALATVRAIKPHLARRYRRMDDRDLAVAGCLLVAARAS